MASRRSQRTDDGTPLAIIQEELFELQRQRRQVALSTPPGPPPDMPYYATVTPPSSASASSAPKLPKAESKFATVRHDDEEEDEEKAEPKPVKSAMKKKKPVAMVDLQDPLDVPYEPSLVQERLSSATVRKVKIGLMLTLFLFVCLYIYPVMMNVPNEKRMSALTLLAYAIGLGALGAGLSDAFRSE